MNLLTKSGRLTDGEFWRKESDFNLIPFTDEEYKKIEALLSPLFQDDVYSMGWANNANKPNTIIDVNEFNEDSGDRLFEIWKLDDEWYFIINWNRHENEGRYLKCDQWDGFQECLTECVNEVLLN